MKHNVNVVVHNVKILIIQLLIYPCQECCPDQDPKMCTIVFFVCLFFQIILRCFFFTSANGERLAACLEDEGRRTLPKLVERAKCSGNARSLPREDKKWR